MLNNKDLATITNTLEVPFVVGSILSGEDKLVDDTQYAMHEALSEMQPETALLAIAISALKIANQYVGACTTMDVMAIECERIIGEFGPVWLRGAQDKALDSDDIFDVLVHTAEDLESLTELLDINADFLAGNNEKASDLCDILHIQAQSHTMIVEAFLSAGETTEQEETSVEITASAKAGTHDAPPVMTIPAHQVNNIIPFPAAVHA